MEHKYTAEYLGLNRRETQQLSVMSLLACAYGIKIDKALRVVERDE